MNYKLLVYKVDDSVQSFLLSSLVLTLMSCNHNNSRLVSFLILDLVKKNNMIVQITVTS